MSDFKLPEHVPIDPTVTLEEFGEMVIKEFHAYLKTVKLGPKTTQLAVSFARIEFERGEAYTPLKDFVSLCVSNAATHTGNVQGEDPETY